MKKQYIHTPLLLIGAIFFLLLSPFNNKVEAAESNILLSEETQQYIEINMREFPEIKPYIDNTIEVFSKEENVNPEELNVLIRRSVDEAIETYTKTNNELKLIEKKNKIRSSANPSSVIIAPSPFVTARNLYNIGINIVRQYGHNQTANYMEHGIVPVGEEASNWQPATHFSIEDNWSRRVATDDSLNGAIFGRFEEEILIKGKTHAVISGTHDFDYGEPATALNKVNYTATFSRRNNGSYGVTMYVGDVFDFEWNSKGYNNFETGFANNYAAMMENFGLIKPYLISIYYTIQ